MEITTHDVKSIQLGGIEELEGSKTHTRRITIQSNDEFTIVCFGDKKDLEIEIQETKKV